MARWRASQPRPPRSEIRRSQAGMRRAAKVFEITLDFAASLDLDAGPVDALLYRLWLAGYQWQPRNLAWTKAKKPFVERIRDWKDLRRYTGLRCNALVDSGQSCASPDVVAGGVLDGYHVYFCAECAQRYQIPEEKWKA